jgi:hypothetical protein
MLDAVSWMQLYNEASTNDGGGPVVYPQETIDKTARAALIHICIPMLIGSILFIKTGHPVIMPT